MSAEPYRNPRCARCYWSLYDGDWCQNPNCSACGKSVGDERVRLTNEEAAELIARKETK